MNVSVHVTYVHGPFKGVAWAGVAITVFFFAFRIYVRLKTFGRLFTDDGLVLLAWVALLTNTALWQVSKEALYIEKAVDLGQLRPPADFGPQLEHNLKRMAAVWVLFYVGLWSIKLSFLIFFKRLGQGVKNQKALWWTVFVVTVASFFTIVGSLPYKCFTSSYQHAEVKNTQVGWLMLRYNMAMDVITDALIIVVPTNMLWKVRISLQQKLALAGIFLLTVFIMLFAIVRISVIKSSSRQPDETWLYLWSSIEQSVSILVACLASFRAIFTKSDRPILKRIHNSDHSGVPWKYFRGVFHFGNKDRGMSEDSNKVNELKNIVPNQNSTIIHAGRGFPDHWHQRLEQLSESEEYIIPLRSVHVRHEIEIC